MKMPRPVCLILCASCIFLWTGCGGGIALLSAVVSDGGGGSGDGSGGSGDGGGSTLTLASPGNVSAVAASHQVTVTWDPVSGATSYNIYWNTAAGVTPTDNKISGATSPYTHTGLSNVSTYYYVVTAQGPGVSASLSETEITAAANMSETSDDMESDPSGEVSASPEFTAESAVSVIPSWIEGGELYGYTGAIEGTTLLVGAPSYLLFAGRAVEFDLADGAWVESEILSPSDSAAGDLFASSMALDENTVVISSIGKNSNEGQVYFFTKSDDGTWSEEILTVSEDAGTQVCQFGYAVSLSGTTAVVGSLQRISDGVPACTVDVVSLVPHVYIFEKTGSSWSQTAAVAASDSGVNSHDYFGFDVAMKGDTMVVGAPRNSTGFVYKGQAYWYRKNNGTWTEQGVLTASDPSTSAFFGAAVAISDDEEKIFVGAPGDDSRTGAVYVFENGVEVTKLTAPDGQERQAFGMRLASSENLLSVGAPSFETVSGMFFAPADDGSVYLFNTDSYELQLKLTGTDSGWGSFGYDVKMDTYLFVGDSGMDEAFIY